MVYGTLMPLYLTPNELSRLMPVNPATTAHCRRVAALAVEIADEMSLSSTARLLLEQAALLHHLPPIVFSPSAWSRLREDLLGASEEKYEPFLPSQIEGILSAFHHGGAHDQQCRTLAEILEISNLLDEQFEQLNSAPKQIGAIWAELSELQGLINSDVLNAARRRFDAPCRLDAVHSSSLPIQAAVAKEVFHTLRRDWNCDLPALARMAGRDPVLAGGLLQTANSAAYSRRSPARSVRQAIAYIGGDAARKVLLALAIRPLFASAQLTDLWKHSLRAAALCESLARSAGGMKPEEALLLGLVHDIGRVAMQTQRAGAVARHTRLTECGCPTVYAEQLLFGEDHGEIGASVLASWDFPADMITAIRYHHRPADTDSYGAAVLYAGEFWLDHGEDLPSMRHLRAALERTGCSMEMLAKADRSDDPLLGLLRAA
jgi:putative nucleotidyltransferase with HDIG domain